jgi:hypothetical protein
MGFAKWNYGVISSGSETQDNVASVFFYIAVSHGALL